MARSSEGAAAADEGAAAADEGTRAWAAVRVALAAEPRVGHLYLRSRRVVRILEGTAIEQVLHAAYAREHERRAALREVAALLIRGSESASGYVTLKRLSFFAKACVRHLVVAGWVETFESSLGPAYRLARTSDESVA